MVEMKVHVAFKRYGAREPYSRRYREVAATPLFEMAHGLAEGFGIVVVSVADGSKIGQGNSIVWDGRLGHFDGRHLHQVKGGNHSDGHQFFQGHYFKGLFR